ncbi:carbon-nitrogen hydrolase family protein [Pseudoclavibacter chungangensis]|uniref:Carbon-nitrogen hydrolase family protein n=1 Tax=Pseudoclavibacter chungangensis TaxID=587635 RepID=A0A7J5BPW2_9MICO|nr:carbon-nitrogen hydrolase family protein [Pseudoclavibacter chungangensis]KAB1652629.1 carbon-nitrogen hydrolase family protein [Pseudoclavibacter chungangensis]NYJ68369.1 putative amidohydrolase [Pseudoclavibacter chungangensis]
MRIALAQISSTGDLGENLRLVGEHIRRAAADGADLLVFPEATMCAFGGDLPAVAEPVDGPWASDVRALAVESGITVVVGMFTPGEGGRVRNTLLVVGPDTATHYDKIHLFDAFGYLESDAVTPGATPVVITVAGTRVGLATCYDLRFPALFVANALAGAEVSVVAASWGDGVGKAEQWALLGRARALDSTTFVVAVDQADPTSVGREPVGGAPSGVGGSQVVSPLGEQLLVLGRGPEYAVVDVVPTAVGEARSSLPVLRNIRPLGATTVGT